MKITPFPSEAFLHELAAWCELAQEALQDTQPLQTTGTRTLKHHLLRQHTTHLAQLQESMRSEGQHASAVNKRMRQEAWSEVFEAIGARDEHVALSACSLLERAVLAAYERAAGHSWLDRSRLRMVRRHIIELKCCRDHYLRRVQTWRDRAARSVEQNVGAVGGMVAAPA